MPAYVSYWPYPSAAGSIDSMDWSRGLAPFWNPDSDEFGVTPPRLCPRVCLQNVSSDNISRTELVEWVSRRCARLPNFFRRDTQSSFIPFPVWISVVMPLLRCASPSASRCGEYTAASLRGRGRAVNRRNGVYLCPPATSRWPVEIGVGGGQLWVVADNWTQLWSP